MDRSKTTKTRASVLFFLIALKKVCFSKQQRHYNNVNTTENVSIFTLRSGYTFNQNYCFKLSHTFSTSSVQQSVTSKKLCKIFRDVLRVGTISSTDLLKISWVQLRERWSAKLTAPISSQTLTKNIFLEKSWVQKLPKPFCNVLNNIINDSRNLFSHFWGRCIQNPVKHLWWSFLRK